MQENKFILFIDDIRESRKISKEDFVRDIVSIRQYIRFLNGETTIKFEILLQFSERLNIDIVTLFTNHYKSESRESSILNNSYKYAHVLEWNKARQELEKINRNDIVSLSNTIYYNYLTLFIDYYQKRMSKNQVIENLCKLINYPKILKNEIVSFAEMNSLIFLSLLLLDDDKDLRIQNYIYDSLLHNKFIANNSDSKWLPSLYSICARTLGKIGKYEKVLSITNKGIQFCMDNHTIHSLKSLLYFKALAQQKLDYDMSSATTISKIYALLELEENNEMDTFFEKKIYDTFNIKKSDIYKKKI